MRQGIILFVQRIFDLPFLGAFKLLHVMLWLTALAFLGAPSLCSCGACIAAAAGLLS